MIFVGWMIYVGMAWLGDALARWLDAPYAVAIYGHALGAIAGIAYIGTRL